MKLHFLDRYPYRMKVKRQWFSWKMHKLCQEACTYQKLRLNTKEHRLILRTANWKEFNWSKW